MVLNAERNLADGRRQRMVECAIHINEAVVVERLETRPVLAFIEDDRCLIHATAIDDQMTTEDNSIVGNILYEVSDEHSLSIQVQFRQSSVTYYKDKYETLRQLYDLFSNRSKDMLVLKKI